MSGKYDFSGIIKELHEKKPLVHHITNYVTVNDCANVTLAVGASPVMADAIEEAADIAAIASSVVLNMGTLNARTIESMLAAGKSANQKGTPVVFDPVGAGASKLRNEAAARILEEVKVSVLRGNISEIRCVAGLTASTKGVDASESDMEDDAGQIARELAEKLGCVVAITGAVDTVSDGNRVLYIENGNPALSSITGTGCMCSSLIGSFAGASPETPFGAAAAALMTMGIAGEIAHEASNRAGNGSFRISLIDAISKMDGKTLNERAKYREA